VYILRTSVGDFEVPVSVVEKGLLTSILAEVARCLESRYSVEDFKKRLETTYKLNSGELNSLAGLYRKLLKLEEEGKNRVWIAIIRNAFAPILKGKFDYVVGNPPWVNWENLPEAYREASRSLWELYGMSKVISTGGFKKDLAMLFLARCFDLYLEEGGRLGFLMPFTVFKTQAGAGFRGFLVGKTRVHVVHDLVTLYPFEGAVNRTSAVVVEKLCEEDLSKAREDNVRGIKHIIWVNPSGKPVPTDKPLEELLEETIRYEALMIPLEPRKPESPWMQVTPRVVEAVRKLLAGQQRYEAHAGVYVGLNQVYYIEIKGKRPDGKLVITNPPEPGQKKRVKQVETVVEPDLVYPLIRGRDIKKWYAEFRNRYVIVPHDPKTGQPIKPEDMKTLFPDAFSYLSLFKEELKNRSIKPFLSLREKIRKAKSPSDRIMAEMELDKWFYRVDNIGAYTFAPYKVVWKRIAGGITGKAVSFACAVVEPIEGKPVIPDDSTILVVADSSKEAYYIAGFLNSTIARTVIASYTYELRQETHILDTIKVPKYDARNEIHGKIAELSRRAHELAKCIYSEARPDYRKDIDAEKELKSVERELDLAVAQLFGLTKDDLKELANLIVILSGEELSAEEEVELPEEPKFSVLNTLLPPNTRSYVEVDVVNPSGGGMEFYYEFPWGKGSFKIVEGKHRIEVPPLKPGKYSGVLRYKWRGVERVVDVVVEVSEQSGPKRRRGLVLGPG